MSVGRGCHPTIAVVGIEINWMGAITEIDAEQPTGILTDVVVVLDF